MPNEYTELEEYRYERKFVSDLPFSVIVGIVKNSSGLFRNIYYPRYINNIYLDSPKLRFYQENIEGRGERKKIRIRWYGDLFGEISHPILEFKIKNGNSGTKYSYMLKNFRFDEKFSRSTLQNSFADSNLPCEVIDELKEVWPKLLNRYNRTYFRSFDHLFRTTIDSNISYFALGNINKILLPKYSEFSQKVIELKYNVQNDVEASSITQDFPFRLSKNSKYVNGIEKTRFVLA